MATEVTGVVASTNEHGIKLEGDDTWLNYSQFGKRPDPPQKGDNVTVKVNDKGFILSIEGGTKGPSGSSAGGSEPRPDTRNEMIARESAVKSAIEMLSHHPAWLEAKVEDKLNGVLVYARRLEGYFLNGGKETE